MALQPRLLSTLDTRVLEIKTVEAPEGVEGAGFFATSLEKVVGIARANSLWPLPFATSCCGIESVGNARTPISVKYFLTAIVFVLFDVEVIFMYPWAVNFRALGNDGFIAMVLFMFFLLAGFLYIIKKGILRWNEA